MGEENVGQVDTGSSPTAGETVTEAESVKTKTSRRDPSDSKTGLHLAAEREVRVDDYPTRTYKQAMTKEQKQHLSDVGLL